MDRIPKNERAGKTGAYRGRTSEPIKSDSDTPKKEAPRTDAFQVQKRQKQAAKSGCLLPLMTVLALLALFFHLM